MNRLTKYVKVVVAVVVVVGEIWTKQDIRVICDIIIGKEYYAATA